MEEDCIQANWSTLPEDIVRCEIIPFLGYKRVIEIQFESSSKLNNYTQLCTLFKSPDIRTMAGDYTSPAFEIQVITEKNSDTNRLQSRSLTVRINGDMIFGCCLYVPYKSTGRDTYLSKKWKDIHDLANYVLDNLNEYEYSGQANELVKYLLKNKGLIEKHYQDSWNFYNKFVKNC